MVLYLYVQDASDATKIGYLKVVGQALIYVKPNASEVDLSSPQAAYSLTSVSITNVASYDLDAASNSDFNITYASNLDNSELVINMQLPFGTPKKGEIVFRNTNATLLTTLLFTATYDPGTGNTTVNARYINDLRQMPSNYQAAPELHEIASYIWDGAGRLFITFGNNYQQRP